VDADHLGALIRFGKKTCLARKKVDTNNLKNGDEKEEAPSSVPESTGNDET
jgi:hypothetical protein